MQKLPQELELMLRDMIAYYGNELYGSYEGVKPKSHKPEQELDEIINYIAQNFVPVESLLPEWTKANQAYQDGQVLNYEYWREMLLFWEHAGNWIKPHYLSSIADTDENE